MNILICEDHKAIQELMSLVLEEEGFKVVKCLDEKCLLQNYDENIDLLIVDYWLNDVSADKAINVIRQKRKDLPIILISAVANIKEIKAKLDIDDYLAKPFDIEELKLKVNNLIYDSKNRNSRG